MATYNGLFNETVLEIDSAIMGNLTLTDTENQLVLGNTTISDIEVLPRTGTIPDTAGESFQFVITADNVNQTIGGVISFSDKIKVDTIEEYTEYHGVTINSALNVDSIATNITGSVGIENISISGNTVYALNFVEPFTGTGINIANTTFRNGFFRCDSITEQTTNAGCNIEGVLIKDSIISTDTITEKTSGSGVTIDGILIKDGLLADTGYTTGILSSNSSGVISSGYIVPGTIYFDDISVSGNVTSGGYMETNTINEHTAASGVTIDGVLLKDGGLTTSISTGLVMSDLGVLYSSYTILPTLYLNAISEASGVGVAIEAITLKDGVITASSYGTGVLHSNSIGTITSSKILASEIDSQFQTNGRVLTADGSANASWELPQGYLTSTNPPSGTNYLTFSTTSSGLSSLKTTPNLYMDYASSQTTLYVPRIIASNGVDKADTCDVSLTSANTNMNIYFGTSSGYNQLRCASLFSFNPSTNILSVPYISSTVTLATDSNNTYFNTAFNTGLTYSLTCIASAAGNYLPMYDAAIVVNPFTTTITASLNGTASNASAISANSNSSSTTLYPLFALSPGGAVYTSGTGFTYVPSSNNLTCGTFTGNLAGNATTATSATNSTYAGIATSANTITLADDSANASDFILFSNSSTGERAIKTNVGLRCNPSAASITATTFIGALSGNSSTSTIASNVTVTNETGATGFLCFTTVNSGDRPVKTNTALLYNGSTNAITATSFIGTATNATNLTGSGTISSSTTATTQTQTDTSTKVATNEFANGVVPIGSVQMYIATTAPNNNWKVCDGSAVSRTTYATLFTLVGTTFGSGDGSTTFNLPDMRERMVYGYKNSTNSMGAVGGAKTVTLTTTELPAHTHAPGTLAVTATLPTGCLTRNVSGGITARTGPTTALYDTSSVTVNAMTGVSASTGSGSAFGILPPYLSLNYIIKVL